MSARDSRFEPQSGPELGFRSRYVLAKIGHDLRACYDDVITEPVPESIGRALSLLDGPEAKVRRISERQSC